MQGTHQARLHPASAPQGCSALRRFCPQAGQALTSSSHHVPLTPGAQELLSMAISSHFASLNPSWKRGLRLAGWGHVPSQELGVVSARVLRS